MFVFQDLEAERNELQVAYNAVQLGQEQSLNRIDDLERALSEEKSERQRLSDEVNDITKRNKVAF